MCLYIKKDQEKNERDLNNFLRDCEKVYVYKILRKGIYRGFYRSIHYPNCIWNFKKQKVYWIDRSSKPTEYELNLGEISQGLHVYVSFRIAQEYFRHFYSCLSDLVIVKFRVNKRDIVAIQNDWIFEEPNFKQLVCKRLEFVEVV
jgi:hypothetical protein